MANEAPVLEKPKAAETPAAAPPPAATTPAPAPAAEKAAWMTPGEKPKEGAPPAAGEKPKEGAPPPAAPAAAATPEKFDLKLPEGTSMEAAVLENYGSELKALGFNQEQAQKLLERDLKVDQARSQAQANVMKANDSKWLNEVKATWGTANFVENSEHAKRGFDFLDPDGSMRKDMEKAGLAHWPKIVYAAAKLGRALAEDKVGLKTETTRSVDKKKPEDALAEQYRKGPAKK